MDKIITFNNSAKKDILASFNLSVNSNDYIVEKDNDKLVLSPEGEPVKLRDFAGIKKGSLLFFKSDISTLISLSDILN